MARGLTVALFGAVTAYVTLPIAAVLLYSLATRWTAHVLPDGYTLEHWRNALADDRLAAALLRSVGLAAVVLALEVVLVVPAAYWARVRNPRIRTVLELGAVIPFALPYVVVAFGLLKLAGDVAPWLLGQPVFLALAQAAVLFPFMYWAVDAAMGAVDIRRLSEAAEACGSPPLRTLRDVVVPNVASGVVAGGILVLAASFAEFALAQVLIGAAFETVPLWSMNALQISQGERFNELAVITFVTFVLLFVLSGAIALRGRGATTELAPSLRSGGRP